MPTAISVRNYSSSTPPTNLTTNIDNQTSTNVIPVVSTAGYPAAPFTACLERNTPNQEFVLVTSVQDSTHFGVVRGYDTTTAVAHQAPATFEHTTGGIDYREANQHHTDVTRDDHTQYMSASGARHDLSARHAVGTTIAAGMPRSSTPGDSGAVGSSAAVAAADHQHQRETTASLLGLVLPVGALIMYGGPNTSTPAGFLFCNGGQISRTAYPVLFNLISTTYGAGDGSTTFNLPNFSGRSPIGTGRASGFGNLYAPGTQYGEEVHALGINEMPVHTHGIYDPGHTHTGLKQQPQYTGSAGGDGDIIVQYVGHTGSLDDGGTFAGVPSSSLPGTHSVPWGLGIAPPYSMITGTSQTGLADFNTGSGAGHNNVPLVLGINFIIRIG